MAKIKIAFIISSLAKQGPVQVLYDIVANIDYSIFDVTILTIKDESTNSLINKFEELPLKVVSIKHSNKYNLFYFYFEINKYIKAAKIDLIHSHCFRSLLLAYFFSNKVKTIHTIHNNPTLQAIALHGKVLGRITAKISKFVIRRIDVPVSCSESVKKEIKLNNKISVRAITNGISPTSQVTDKKAIQKELNLNTNYKYFISVGRFSPEKNFKTLVEAFIEANIPNTKLILLGEGKTINSIKEISNENILLLGFKLNVADFLAACDYYISTSLTEGMPLSVLEALSHGLPVALSDIPPHQEILKKGRKIGYLFPVNNVPKTALALKNLYNSDYQKLQENSKFVFSKYFTAELMSNEYQKLYQELV